jgi:hypothetical protein
MPITGKPFDQLVPGDRVVFANSVHECYIAGVVTASSRDGWLGYGGFTLYGTYYQPKDPNNPADYVAVGSLSYMVELDNREVVEHVSYWMIAPLSYADYDSTTSLAEESLPIATEAQMAVQPRMDRFVEPGDPDYDPTYYARTGKNQRVPQTPGYPYDFTFAQVFSS